MERKTKEYWDKELETMFDPKWQIDYNNQKKTKYEALLDSGYIPKNDIERQLFQKAKEFAVDQLQWLANGAKDDEGGSESFDTWLESFLTECGLPEDNYHLFDFNVNKPFPKDAFCRDAYTVHGFYEMTESALIELADSLLEYWTPAPPEIDEDDDLIKDLIESTHYEVDESLFDTLFPEPYVGVNNQRVNKVVRAFAESKNPLQRIFSVLMKCSINQNKPAFLLSKDDLGKLLKNNKLIDRKSINNDYNKFLGYCFRIGFLVTEVDYVRGSRKARMVSLGGKIRDLIRLHDDPRVDLNIDKIVQDYKLRNNKAQQKAEVQSEVQMVVSNSDLDLCAQAMSLKHLFNEIDSNLIPGIYNYVQKHGSFKSEKQRTNISNFLKFHQKHNRK